MQNTLIRLPLMAIYEGFGKPFWITVIFFKTIEYIVSSRTKMNTIQCFVQLKQGRFLYFKIIILPRIRLRVSQKQTLVQKTVFLVLNLKINLWVIYAAYNSTKNFTIDNNKRRYSFSFNTRHTFYKLLLFPIYHNRMK